MIDREHRDRLAELIRHLANGRITTGEFDDFHMIVDSEDPAVSALSTAAWGLYDDVWPAWAYRLRGRHKLPPGIRHEAALWAVFLYSDTEYEWPDDLYSPPGGDCLLILLCALLIPAGVFLSMFSVLSSRLPVLGVACLFLATCIYSYSQRLDKRARERWITAQNEVGDYDVWPFLHTSDFQEARKHPKLLAGSSDNTALPREG